MYVNVLRGSKLESKLREKPRGSGRSVESIMLQMKRCSSLGDLDLSSGYKGRNVRESYVMAIYKGWGSNLFAVKKFMSQLAFAIQVEEVTITMIQIIQFPQKYVVVYTIWLVTVEKMLAISYLFWWRANARNNISFGTLYRGHYQLSWWNPNYLVILSHQCSTTVSLETDCLYSLISYSVCSACVSKLED